ncbi:ATP-binding protein [Streptomyces alkaliterrae]|uniref:ATP-binding protein n=1 Tax=Streptomyces alkaliterrae TaxID=2213162 RepID=A0A5P0YRA8_9ACTN|nr:ATP-binding protein [Streptomyces alkaliterrae]MBB1252970.1 ATP-binding protein [Streptomyces alkaliterrae]MBB1257319.1 ATP-binding protein [Streptomyces alkaliterrae]MQS01059.1 ATP-binding protein [Streptomyces alkaliterrae]
MADHQEASVSLPSTPASVGSARRYVSETLAQWGLPADSALGDAVALIVSELATNAVLHTRGQSPEFTLRLLLERQETLRVGVTDSHHRLPRRLPAAVQQDNGRGLAIIRALTAEFGGALTVVPAGGGKTVWISLGWPDPLALAASH